MPGPLATRVLPAAGWASGSESRWNRPWQPPAGPQSQWNTALARATMRLYGQYCWQQHRGEDPSLLQATPELLPRTAGRYWQTLSTQGCWPGGPRLPTGEAGRNKCLCFLKKKKYFSPFVVRTKGEFVGRRTQNCDP